MGSTLTRSVIQFVLFIHFILPISTQRVDEDSCSNCRGDNSTCRVVAGIFTRAQLNVGYNLVAHIPRGVCNLNISEIRRSPNHLALKRNNGTYIFNGEWKLSQSGQYSSAGTIYTYVRQDLKTMESVTSSGPTQESLDLMVLYQQPNPGIKYEYKLPSSLDSGSLSPVVPLVEQDSLLNSRSSSGREYHYFRQAAPATSRPSTYNIQYSSGGIHRGGRADSTLSTSSSSILHLQQPQKDFHHQPPFNSLSAFPLNKLGLPDFGGVPTPGGATLYPGGPDTLSVYGNGGRSNNGANIVSNSHHHLHSHRRRNHAAKTSVSGAPSSEKRFYWKITGYTECSEPCGGGLQRSIIRCVRGTTSNANVAVPDRRCAFEKPPQVVNIPCNVKPCPAEWIAGEWSSECSARECGEGLKTRSVYCQQRISPTLTMRVTEAACLKRKPESTMACSLKPCNHWRAGEFSDCSAPCGNGIRKRTVICVAGSLTEPGNVLEAEECDQAEKPAELTACNMGPCEGVEWFVSEWSHCSSAKCGRGIQTRDVVCSVLQHPQTQPIQYYSYDFRQHQNGSGVRLSSSHELDSNLIEDDSSSSSGESQMETPVSSQSSSPSFQFQERQAQESCEVNRRPPDERECYSERSCGEGTWFASDWGDCSVSCGTGIRTRQILCLRLIRGRFKVAHDDDCASDLKPEGREVCVAPQECPHRWFSSDWSECSALCGGGIQKRSVSCRQAGNWTVTSSLCTDKERPVERRACNEQKCTLNPATPPTNDSRPNVQQDHGTGAGALNSPVIQHGSSNSSSHHHQHRHPQQTQQQTSEAHPQMLEDEKDDADCKDEYRNCALVVQARLCRYRYYKSVCCESCSNSAVF